MKIYVEKIFLEKVVLSRIERKFSRLDKNLSTEDVIVYSTIANEICEEEFFLLKTPRFFYLCSVLEPVFPKFLDRWIWLFFEISAFL